MFLPRRAIVGKRTGTMARKTFGWIGDFSDCSRELRVRIQPASDGGCWIFIQREQ